MTLLRDAVAPGRQGPKAAWLALHAGLICGGCDSVVVSQNCSIEHRPCWETLGLADHRVESLLETPVGLYAGTRDGVYRRGTTGGWMPSGIGGHFVSALVLSPATGGIFAGVRPVAAETTAAAVFSSTDAGDSWTPSDGQLAAMNDDRFWAYALAVDPADEATVWWGASASVLRSPDAGQTWEFVYGRVTSFGLGVNDIFVPAEGPVWVAGTGAIGVGYALRSDDRGANWELMLPFDEAEIGARSVLQSPTGASVWVGMVGGIIESNDGGASWEVVVSEAGSVNGIVAIGSSIYAASSLSRGSTTELRLYRFDLANHRWRSVSVPSSTGALSLAAGDDGTVLIGTVGSGVWRFRP